MNNQALGRYIESCSRRAFGWGTWDCCLFAADAVKAMTGRDPASRLRATYCNEAEALAIITAGGGIDSIVEKAGLKPVTSPFQNGDIGRLKMKGHITALVVYWQGRFLAATKKGLTEMDQRHIDLAFRP